MSLNYRLNLALKLVWCKGPSISPWLLEKLGRLGAVAFIQALQVVGHLRSQAKQMFQIRWSTVAGKSRRVHRMCHTPGGQSTATTKAFNMWNARKQSSAMNQILKTGNLKTEMTEIALKNTHFNVSNWKNPPLIADLYINKKQSIIS